ncbi:MAG: aminotransferase class V [Burkholderiales bacterium RIFCSPLOWO2_12_FULL_64_99]|nr:MAG: aminotransferase class V [Burkholderiales bacterium RIFCSPHIGHO2_12_FULL_63_20]OGB60497.1 MAG: aminotransferase class V [Burkholderiales bacterium RIFCSPLOWO2_12_FULL_64_99]
MSTSDLAGLGVPDAQALAQLANQFFSALPGSAPGGAGVPAGLPPGLSHLSSPTVAHPFAVPPVSNAPVSPASSGYEGVPALPPVAAPGQVPPSFAGDLPLDVNPASRTGGVQPILTLNPLDWGLPSDAELSEMLALRSPSRAPQAAPGGATPSFYFLAAGLSGLAGHAPGVQVPGQAAQPLSPQAQGFAPPVDVNLVRRDFPVLNERVNGKPLIWLDNAATTHKPQSVIDRIAYFYAHENSNIHRAAHELAARATDAYEAAREKVRDFVNARSVNEIVFVRGTTEAINLVAKSWGEANIGAGDEIIVSHLEHHANIVPWQQLCARTGAKLRVIPVDDDGQVRLDEYAKLLNARTKLVSFTQVSNALGTVTPAKQIVAMAHSAGAKVLVDGAQSVSHLRADVIDLDCDWFVFSGHKVFGPTGIGVLYGKEALLNETPPWQGGGNMIKDVTFEHTDYHDAPGRFEAGTGNIADAVGLGAAIDYVQKLGIENIAAYEHQLLLYGTRLLQDVPGLKLIGTAPDKAAVLSFTLQGFKTEEVGAALNKEGIAVRSGHHCAQPILRRFGLEATVRPSLAFYNTCAEIDTLVATLHKLSSSQRRVY